MPLSVEDEKVILGECYVNQRIDSIYFLTIRVLIFCIAMYGEIFI